MIEVGHGRVGIVMRPPGCAAGAVRKTGLMAGSSIRILLVEADAPLRTLLAEVLREHGYTVAEAADGRSALDAMRAVPDAVVLDLQLPHLAGPGAQAVRPGPVARGGAPRQPRARVRPAVRPHQPGTLRRGSRLRRWSTPGG